MQCAAAANNCIRILVLRDLKKNHNGCMLMLILALCFCLVTATLCDGGVYLRYVSRNFVVIICVFSIIFVSYGEQTDEF